MVKFFKSKFKWIKNFFSVKKNLIIGISLLAVLIVILLLAIPKQPKFNYFEAKRADLIQEVSVTGIVKASKNVDLAFERSGRVEKIYSDAGSKVYFGGMIARLASGDLAADLAQAIASRDAESARLEELKKGSRPEEIAVEQSKVDSAKASLADAQKALMDKISDAYTKSDDAVRTQADKLFNNPRSNNPQLIFGLYDSGLESRIEYGRLAMEERLVKWKQLIDAPSANTETNADFAKTSLNQVKNFLDDCAAGLNSAILAFGVTQAQITSWQTDIAAARVSISTAITALVSSEEKVESAESSLNLAETGLELKKAGYTSDQIAIQEAKVRQMEANIQGIRAQIAKTEIISPISGIVAKNNVKVGEIVSSGFVAFSVISEMDFEIEANIPEADIMKIKIGALAQVTLDAYGNDVKFEAAVTKIDPAETVIEGVSTYKTTFHFTSPSEMIKSGMTANIDVLTDSRSGVIVIPIRAVFEKDGKKLVKILEGRTPKEKEVFVGMRGSDGNMEILSGINEGDKVITNPSSVK